ncbi:DinB family protein [Salininema proteolyticum]|uniref:DinB family protein n=1 Tax=Salininema proteolyticum TaxID=1607685 RepID=A0ABV8U3N7_9ACTN
MSDNEVKAHLLRYLQAGHDALLWKLDGLGEYDLRRPMTDTATNLLGLVKHVAATEAGYFGEVFGRPLTEPLPWTFDEEDPNADMWAEADESTELVKSVLRRVQAHTATVVEELDLDTVGRVPWWPDERADVTLHQILVHMIAEVHRHAGHADIVRENIDGAAGMQKGNDNLPMNEQEAWAEHRAKVERAAREASDR